MAVVEIDGYEYEVMVFDFDLGREREPTESELRNIDVSRFHASWPEEDEDMLWL